MEFTEAESNMNDLVSEYQQYQGEAQGGVWGRMVVWLLLHFACTPCCPQVPTAHRHPMYHPIPLASDATAEEEGEG